MRILAGFLFCLALAPPAVAGPWLREKGRTFTSTSVTLNHFQDAASSTYIEHGLREDMTVGADIGVFRNTTAGPSGTATIFLRRPWGNRDGQSLWAYELGAGASWDGAVISPHAKTGVTWGRGITFRDKGGWTTVDASYRWDLGAGEDVFKLDGTLGLNFTDRVAGMFQVYVSHSAGETSATLAPSVIYAAKSGKTKWQLGIESPLSDTARTAIKFGLWRDF
ncbi:hypothetical protein [Blastomonas sp.]|uniref:hypothetical protein n=1 Tax=Blastomonas sp. TaxID=1909299 RepID=UPI0035938B50